MFRSYGNSGRVEEQVVHAAEGPRDSAAECTTTSGRAPGVVAVAPGCHRRRHGCGRRLHLARRHGWFRADQPGRHHQPGLTCTWVIPSRPSCRRLVRGVAPVDQHHVRGVAREHRCCIADRRIVDPRCPQVAFGDRALAAVLCSDVDDRHDHFGSTVDEGDEITLGDRDRPTVEGLALIAGHDDRNVGCGLDRDDVDAGRSVANRCVRRVQAPVRDEGRVVEAEHRGVLVELHVECAVCATRDEGAIEQPDLFADVGCGSRLLDQRCAAGCLAVVVAAKTTGRRRDHRRDHGRDDDG